MDAGRAESCSTNLRRVRQPRTRPFLRAVCAYAERAASALAPGLPCLQQHAKENFFPSGRAIFSGRVSMRRASAELVGAASICARRALTTSSRVAAEGACGSGACGSSACETAAPAAPARDIAFKPAKSGWGYTKARVRSATRSHARSDACNNPTDTCAAPRPPRAPTATPNRNTPRRTIASSRRRSWEQQARRSRRAKPPQARRLRSSKRSSGGGGGSRWRGSGTGVGAPG